MKTTGIMPWNIGASTITEGELASKAMTGKCVRKIMRGLRGGNLGFTQIKVVGGEGVELSGTRVVKHSRFFDLKIKSGMFPFGQHHFL